MTEALEMFGACYLYVLCRAFQQRNVAFDNYGWVVPTSYCMAILDVFIIAFVAHAGWTPLIVFANGSGGCLGALSAMLLHKRWVKKSN
jgi:hypothetical protein